MRLPFVVSLTVVGLAALPLAADQPENTSCENAQFVIEGESPGAFAADGTTGAWFEYLSVDTSYVAFRAEGVSGQAKIEVWSACPGEGRLLASGTSTNSDAASTLVFANAGERFLIRLDDLRADRAGFKLFVVPNDFTYDQEGGGGGGAGPVGADVIMSEVQTTNGADSFGQVGGIIGYSMPSYTCNIGDAHLAWINAGTPAFAMNVFRLHDGRMLQIGVGQCKSACCVANSPNCGLTCQSGPSGHLRAGCRDVYGSGFNAGQSRLAPRSVINAFTGTVGSFPGTSGDAIFRRMQVRQTDLTQFPGAIYFTESVYVCTEEVDGSPTTWNNASHDRVVYNSGTLALAKQGATQVGIPAIRSWRTHGLGVNQLDDRVVDGTVDVPGEGRFFTAAKVTDLGAGQWRYDYAVYNLTSDRSGGSFSVPLPLGSTVTNVGFHDVQYHSDDAIYDPTDWTVEQTGTSITWRSPQTFAQNPNSNALRWGTMYNFWFETNRMPGNGSVTLGLFKPGTPSDVSIAASVPVGPTMLPGDTNCDSIVNFDDIDTFVTALIGQQAYDELYPSCRYLNADVNGDAFVNFEDIEFFVVCIIESVCN